MLRITEGVASDEAVREGGSEPWEGLREDGRHELVCLALEDHLMSQQESGAG